LSHKGFKAFIFIHNPFFNPLTNPFINPLKKAPFRGPLFWLHAFVLIVHAFDHADGVVVEPFQVAQLFCKEFSGHGENGYAP